MPQYDKRHSFTQIAMAAVAAARFVTRTGTHASTSSDVAGISEAAASVGRAFSTLTSFSGVVEAAEAIADGALVKPAADGSGRVAVGSASDNCGWAVSGAAAGGLVTVHPVERMQSMVSGAGNKAQKYMSGGVKPLSDALASSAANTTFCSQQWSKRRFVAVRQWFSNYLDSTVAVSISKVAPAASSNADATTLTWTQSRFQSAASGVIPAGLPAASGAVSVNDSPAFLASDISSAIALDRNDGGLGYLLQTRAYINQASVQQVIAAGDAAAFNSALGQQWLSAAVVGDVVTNISAQALSGTRWLVPSFVEFFYDKPTIRIAQAGDSLAMGAESTSNHWSVLQRVCDALDTTQRYVVPALFGIGGQSYGATRNTALGMLNSGLLPSVMLLNVWSPNTALTSDSVAEIVKGYVAAVISRCHELGVAVVLGTSGPVDNQTAAEIARRYALNQYARDLFTAGAVEGLADWGPQVEDPANPGKRLPAYVGAGGTQSHYNDAGYAVIAGSYAAACQSLI